MTYLVRENHGRRCGARARMDQQSSTLDGTDCGDNDKSIIWYRILYSTNSAHQPSRPTMLLRISHWRVWQYCYNTAKRNAAAIIIIIVVVILLSLFNDVSGGTHSRRVHVIGGWKNRAATSEIATRTACAEGTTHGTGAAYGRTHAAREIAAGLHAVLQSTAVAATATGPVVGRRGETSSVGRGRCVCTRRGDGARCTVLSARNAGESGRSRVASVCVCDGYTCACCVLL
jgi:hypothetical protein